MGNIFGVSIWLQKLQTTFQSKRKQQNFLWIHRMHCCFSFLQSIQREVSQSNLDVWHFHLLESSLTHHVCPDVRLRVPILSVNLNSPKLKIVEKREDDESKVPIPALSKEEGWHEVFFPHGHGQGEFEIRICDDENLTARMCTLIRCCLSHHLPNGCRQQTTKPCRHRMAFLVAQIVNRFLILRFSMLSSE